MVEPSPQLEKKSAYCNDDDKEKEKDTNIEVENVEQPPVPYTKNDLNIEDDLQANKCVYAD